MLLIAVMLIAAMDLVMQIEDPETSDFVFELLGMIFLCIGLPIAVGCYAIVYAGAFMFYFVKGLKNK